MRGGKRRWLAPEIVQTSGMDCGPAALAAVLEGFGIRASYGRLREACQTEVDGTSIDTLEEVLVKLGLGAEQVLVPSDHVLVGEAALPAIAVVRLPSGFTHFVVLWRAHGRRVQIMDPASGRRFVPADALLRSLLLHTLAVPEGDLRAWAASPAFLDPLRQRIAALGVKAADVERRIDEALADEGHSGLAALDAATRLLDGLVRSRGVGRGKEASALLAGLLSRARRGPASEVIPPRFWILAPTEGGLVPLTGAVLLRISGPRARPSPAPERADSAPLAPELAAALAEPKPRPLRAMGEILRREGHLPALALVPAVAVAGALTLVESLLLRGLVDVSGRLTLGTQRLAALACLVAFFGLGLLLDARIVAALQALGRSLERALRVRFLEKIPRLGVRYFRSRPASDMTDRLHDVQRLRGLPDLAAEVLRSLAGLAATTCGIALLAPRALFPALAVAGVSVVLPCARARALAERDLRFRTHDGALSRFHLDALLGGTPIRAHGAERAVRREHDRVLVGWIDAGRSFLRLTVLTDLLGALLTTAFAAWLVLAYADGPRDRGGVLLVALWSLGLGALGRRLASALGQYPALRNAALRLFEPLDAPEEIPPLPSASSAPSPASTSDARGVAIRIEGVTVHAGGRPVLEGVEVAIAPGEHVAVVGPSGAGKSSLVGLLLGWHRPSSGAVRIDGAPLDAAALHALRRRTAWVDPAVQLWNRSLLDNLLYGASPDRAVDRAVRDAELRGVLDRLPEGLATSLGEGGALVSGGEGQRVRLGRAFARTEVRLALLDEPFRGLDAGRRHALLARARARWASATLLCVTHDVHETLAFPRVLVIENGRVVEDGAPADLAARAGSRYAALLRAETTLRRELWGADLWKRFVMDRGVLVPGATQEAA